MCAYLRFTPMLDDSKVLRKMEPIPDSNGMTQTALAFQRERAVFICSEWLLGLFSQAPLCDSRCAASQLAKSFTSANFPLRASIENTGIGAVLRESACRNASMLG